MFIAEDSVMNYELDGSNTVGRQLRCQNQNGAAQKVVSKVERLCQSVTMLKGSFFVDSMPRLFAAAASA